jgi:hypothetical protein
MIQSLQYGVFKCHACLLIFRHERQPRRAQAATAAYITGMIRLTITVAAYEAIAATLPSSVGLEAQRAPNGDYYVWLDPRYVDRLKAVRGPGESYSDVILRLAAAS